MNYDLGFAVIVSDDCYRHLGIFKGDKVICDYVISNADRVVCVLEGKACICTRISDGCLFDEAARMEAPPDTKVLGRVVELVRRLIPANAEEVRV